MANKNEHVYIDVLFLFNRIDKQFSIFSNLTYIKCLPADFGLEIDWAALDSVEGRNVSVAKARVENLCHG